MIRVPWPGLEMMASSPLTAAKRSRMLVNPAPAATCWVEAGAVVAHLEVQRRRRGHFDHGAAAPAACFAAFWSASRQQKYAALSISRE